MIELEIKFDGDVPGIAERRLSVDAFGAPLEELLRAARRIATATLVEALEDAKYGAGGGRLAKEAMRLDLQVKEIGDGSLRLALVFAMRVLPGDIFGAEDLPARTGKILIEAIRDESAGKARNFRVRKYLESLPDALVKQEYDLLVDGKVVDSVRIGEVKLAAIPDELPYLVSAKGHIVAVGFDPGKNEVRIRTQENQSQAYVATAAQVDAAIALRAVQVSVQGVMTKDGLRLLSMHPAGEERALSEDEIKKLVFDKWADLLKRLA